TPPRPCRIPAQESPVLVRTRCVARLPLEPSSTDTEGGARALQPPAGEPSTTLLQGPDTPPRGRTPLRLALPDKDHGRAVAYPSATHVRPTDPTRPLQAGLRRALRRAPHAGGHRRGSCLAARDPDARRGRLPRRAPAIAAAAEPDAAAYVGDGRGPA